MRLPETRDLFAREIDFPATKESVVNAVGDTDLDAPSGQTEAIADVLKRTETEDFRSSDELYDTLVTFVSDAFIGRKFYDDRGGQATDPDEEVSF